MYLHVQKAAFWGDANRRKNCVLNTSYYAWRLYARLILPPSVTRQVRTRYHGMENDAIIRPPYLSNNKLVPQIEVWHQTYTKRQALGFRRGSGGRRS